MDHGKVPGEPLGAPWAAMVASGGPRGRPVGASGGPRGSVRVPKWRPPGKLEIVKIQLFLEHFLLWGVPERSLEATLGLTGVLGGASCGHGPKNEEK